MSTLDIELIAVVISLNSSIEQFVHKISYNAKEAYPLISAMRMRVIVPFL